MDLYLANHLENQAPTLSPRLRYVHLYLTKLSLKIAFFSPSFLVARTAVNQTPKISHRAIIMLFFVCCTTCTRRMINRYGSVSPMDILCFNSADKINTIQWAEKPHSLFRHFETSTTVLEGVLRMFRANPVTFSRQQMTLFLAGRHSSGTIVGLGSSRCHIGSVDLSG